MQNIIICLVKKHDDDKQTHSPSMHNKYIANVAELFIKYRYHYVDTYISIYLHTYIDR